MVKQENVLIVDDEIPIRQLLYKKLSSEGYRCQQAADAAHTLDKLRSNAVSLAILDIRMPGKSGIELLTEIKAGYPDTSVIMATGVADTSIAVQCMKQGAYDYITKPFDLDEVILSVGRALEARRLELENRECKQHLEEKVTEQAKKIHTSFLNSIMALAYALEVKDKYTSGHSQRVANISVAIAKEMGLSQETVDTVKLAGLVHDIGKMGISESVLNKPGRLTKEELQHVQQHPEIGERILAPIADSREILQYVRGHHERYDGSGYPDQIKGTQISLGARILAIADAYEAMTSKRPYREAMNDEVACTEINRNAGKQFDPDVVDAFYRSRDNPVIQKYEA